MRIKNFTNWLTGRPLLTEATFSTQSWNHHDRFDYCKMVVDDLLNGKKVLIGKDGKDGWIDIDDFDESMLKAISSNPQNYTHLDFDNAMIDRQSKFGRKGVWTSIYKSPYSNVFSKRSGAAKTTESAEIGFLIWLDYFVEFGDNITVDDLEDYVPSSRILGNVGGDDNITASIAMMEEDRSWSQSNYNSARAIYQSFDNLRNYSFHRGDKIFDKIKNLGGKLANCQVDKWNPSDVILIRNDFKPSMLSQFKSELDLSEYNKFVGSHDIIIGISLKKSTQGALHGSYSLMNYYKNSNDRPFKNFKNFESDVDKVLDDFEKIKRSDVSSIVYLDDYRGGVLSDQLIEIDSLKVSNNFAKSWPVAVHFIAQLASKGGDYLYKILEFFADISESKSSISCDYIKAADGVVDYINNSSLDHSEFSIDRIVIPVNGQTQILIFANHLQTNKVFQIRSKGSFPQIISLGEKSRAQRLTPINQVNIE